MGEDYSLLAWTTTPWTLPSNMALCVNPEAEYTLFEGEVPNNPKNKGRFVVMTARLFGVKGAMYKEQNKGYTVIQVCFESCCAEFLSLVVVRPSKDQI